MPRTLLTRRSFGFGNNGGPARAYDLLTVAADSDEQPLIPQPPPVRWQHGVSTVPCVNRSGASRAVGVPMCWCIDPDGRQYVELPSARNLFKPAGVVVFNAIPDDAPGWLANGGVPVNAYVLGSSTLGAGSVLDVVAGQTYLQVAASTVAGRMAHFVLEEDHFQASVVLRRVTVRCPL